MEIYYLIEIYVKKKRRMIWRFSTRKNGAVEIFLDDLDEKWF